MISPLSFFQKVLKGVVRSRFTLRLVGTLSLLLVVSLAIPVVFTNLQIESLAMPAGLDPDRVQNLAAQAFVTVVVVLVFATLGVFLLVEPMVRPLRIIIEQVKSISQIKDTALLARFDIRSGDELEELANELKEMVRRFQGTIQRERQISEMKSEFLSLAAHQLRTPLSAMKWALSDALNERDYRIKSELRGLLEKSYASNERMINLVNSILDIVQIEEGKFNYVFKKVRPNEILLNVWKDMQPLGKHKGLTMVFQEPSRSLPELFLDQKKLVIALRNLLENAIHYTLPNGRVELSAERKPSTLEVTIQDTGIGISEKDLPHLFTKFFRGKNAVKADTEGTGLGLYIAKNIVERHNGKIMVHSQEGKGSVFTVSLPVPRESQKISEKAYQDFIKTF